MNIEEIEELGEYYDYMPSLDVLSPDEIDDALDEMECLFN